MPARQGARRVQCCLLLLALAASAAAEFSLSGDAGNTGDASPQPWVELLSWKPRVYLYHKFLSDEECDHIIKIALPHIARSTVVDPDGSIVDDPIRTSWGTFLARGQDEVVYAIEHRIANWTHFPVEHLEDMQVLRYSNNQTYGGHWDDLDSTEGDGHGLDGTSVRVATVLLYLTDAELGGETAFPASRWLDAKKQTAGQPFSACAKGGVAALPRKGNAVLFFDTKLGSTRQDKFSYHAGCPVLKGEKWAAAIWIHGQPFGGPYPDAPLATSGASLEAAERLLAAKRRTGEIPLAECRDSNAACPNWAANGQCTKNAKQMRKTCPLSCRECCLRDDVLCERELRRRIILWPGR